MEKLDGIIILNTITIVIATLLTAINIPVASFYTLTLLMIFDFILGIGKSYRMCIPITSYKMKLGALSKLGLLIIVISFGIVATHSGIVIENMHTYLQWVLALFMLSELYSIISNVYAMKKGEELPEFEVLSLLGGKLKLIMERLMPNQKDRNE